jgi:hypothetical protein
MPSMRARPKGLTRCVLLIPAFLFAACQAGQLQGRPEKADEHMGNDCPDLTGLYHATAVQEHSAADDYERTPSEALPQTDE